MTLDFRALCAELLLALEGEGYTHWTHSPDEDDLVLRARAALAEPKPPCRYIYNPAQIAECGGPCEQGPKHCDCGELWLAEPEPAAPEGREPASVTERPPADGEVAELVEWLYEQLHVCLQAPWTPGIKHFGRAAQLLQRQYPRPVPVSERLPRPEDCDGEGKCWWFHDEDNASCSHWLPANALPLPQGEVEP